MPQLLRIKCGLLKYMYFSKKILPAGRQRVGTVFTVPIPQSHGQAVTNSNVTFHSQPTVHGMTLRSAFASRESTTLKIRREI